MAGHRTVERVILPAVEMATPFVLPPCICPVGAVIEEYLRGGQGSFTIDMIDLQEMMGDVLMTEDADRSSMAPPPWRPGTLSI